MWYNIKKSNQLCDVDGRELDSTPSIGPIDGIAGTFLQEINAP